MWKSGLWCDESDDDLILSKNYIHDLSRLPGDVAIWNLVKPLEVEAAGHRFLISLLQPPTLLHHLQGTGLGILNAETGANMFNLSKLEHTLRLKPHLLSLPLNEAVKGELEGLFLDKVIANLGLCISVYDIESIDGGFIFANEGAPTYTVKFRLIIFRPFVGEIISAKLKESNADGLRLSLGFFDDIYIPELLMPEPSRAEPDPENKNQVKWIWTFNDEEYLIDGYDEIRFRVQNVKFPEIPKEQKELKPFAPVEIIGSLVSEGGLGPISWWV